MIYVQTDSDKQIAHHFDCSCALYGAIETGQSYKLITLDEVASGKFDMVIRRNLFVGSTEFMREVFKRVNKLNVRVPENTNRPCEIITLGEAYKRVEEGDKIFVKPLEIKLFTGLVLDGMKYTCLTGIPEETLVMVYAPFNTKIESEWRIYIHNHKMVDARNYSGDFIVGPDYTYVLSVIEQNKTKFPCAYTIDIGILYSGENVVIEYNDMWAIGNYGIPNDLYVRLLKDRYFEII